MSTQLNPISCYDAVSRDDPQFDGQFFVAVLTTGIFCRPNCRSRTPRPENVLFFATAAAAAEAGFRPCLVCRPESAPDLPESEYASPVVRRAVRLIGQGFLDEHDVGELARRLNLSQRHLRRLFLAELGVPPVAIAQTRRLLFAKKLIDETNLTMADIAFSAGYASIRRFNNAIRQTYARTPSEMRRRRRRSLSDADASVVELHLYYRDPYNWPAVLAYLRARAVPLVERVDADGYQRSIRLGGTSGILHVRPIPEKRAVLVRVPSCLTRYLLPITERVKQIFDLRADPVSIDSALIKDPLLAPVIRAQPGIRVPGAWDGLELAVCAMLDAYGGQTGRPLVQSLVRAFGEESRGPDGHAIVHLFPTPQWLVDAPFADLGVPIELAESIQRLSRDTAEERISLSEMAGSDEVGSYLSTLPGMDVNTRRHIMMRIFRQTEPCDAIRTTPGNCPSFSAIDTSPERIEQRCTEPWRRWGAYATMYGSVDTVGRSAL